MKRFVAGLLAGAVLWVVVPAEAAGPKHEKRLACVERQLAQIVRGPFIDLECLPETDVIRP